MGEAKRRRMLEQAGAGNDTPGPEVNRELVGRAVRQVVGAITSAPGADCALFALVGAELLRHLGVKAQAVAGSAVWRVGPGDGDVINHAVEVADVVYAPSLNPTQQAALMHAWIRIDESGREPAQTVDLTAFQLAKKARDLDAIDGGRTQVDFCPEMIWVEEAKHSYNPRKVAQSFDTGVFSYIRKPGYEPQIFNADLVQHARAWGHAALVAYRHLKAGRSLQVLGVDESGTAAPADESRPLNLRQVELDNPSVGLKFRRP